MGDDDCVDDDGNDDDDGVDDDGQRHLNSLLLLLCIWTVQCTMYNVHAYTTVYKRLSIFSAHNVMHRIKIRMVEYKQHYYVSMLLFSCYLSGLDFWINS